MSTDRILEYIEGLSRIEYRLAGSKAEKQACQFIKKQLTSFGFKEIIESPFQVYGWYPKSVAVEIVSPVRKKITSALFPYSPSIDVESKLVRLNHLDKEEPSKREGMVGLASWGPHLYLSPARTCFSAQRQKLGAVLVASPDEGNLRKVVVTEVGPEMKLPLLSISKEDADFLSNLMERGEVEIKIVTEVEVDENASSSNLEVSLEGEELSSHEVFIGAHYDAYFHSAADGGAPAAIVLELARLMSEYVKNGGQLRRTVRFLFFGAEECGGTTYYYWINGSRAYVRANPEIVSRAAVILSLDSIGYNAQNHIVSTLELEEFARGLVESIKNPRDVNQYGPPAYGSDHWFFEISGVPTIYGVSFPSPLYHTQKDDIENLDRTSVEFYAEFMKKSIFDIANAEILPHDIFTPLQLFESIIMEYRQLPRSPFGLEKVLRRIERILRERNTFSRMIRKAAVLPDKSRIEEVNRFIVSTVQHLNRTIGWVWRKPPPMDVSYMSRLELIRDYVELNAAISSIRRMPISNLDRDTVARYTSLSDNPYDWIDVHGSLAKLETERSKIFGLVDEEISRLVEVLDDISSGLRRLIDTS
ncbi:MAG: M28 family peptidase [Candidatus Thorarchaeota archaeon]|nr:MAG: M28 family peptidase [Candidatus Thorarchaeota archaeon]